ncbi:MAG: DUF4159 domain-containing protein [Lentisphaeraceae bacterium]|nr:DUF4159 domain-containing protein [Lentisphaeraceae bacterium]
MIRLLAITFFFLCCTSSAQVNSETLNNDAIQKKIDSLVSDILNAQQPNGSWLYKGRNQGSTALHLLALNSAGLSEKNPAIAKGLNYLLQNPPKSDVYSVSLTIFALQKINSKKFFKKISRAAKWLINSQHAGTWNYTGTGTGDNSVTQFALLALKAAETAGVKIPKATYESSKKHFISYQNLKNGGWAYKATNPTTTSMTSAALASLKICGIEEEISLELLNGSKYCGIYKTDSRISKGFKFLAERLRNSPNEILANNYTLYALERAGILYDKNFIGDSDWFKIGTKHILDQANSSGKYLPEAFKPLFLSKGNSPYLVSKLKWGSNKDWNNRHKDMRHFTSIVSNQIKQELTWQNVSLNDDSINYLRAPILNISGKEKFSLTKAELQNLDKFLNNDGYILITPCLNSTRFQKSIEEELQELYPDTSFQEIPEDHPFRRSHFDLRGKSLDLKVLKGTCDSKNVYLATNDISLSLESKNINVGNKEILLNLTKLALKEKPLIPKLAKPKLKKRNKSQLFESLKGTTEKTSTGIQLAQAILPNNLDYIKPESMNNLLAFMTNSLKIQTQTGINIIDLKDRTKLSNEPVIYISGRKSFNLDEQETENLKNYLQNGGFIFADSICSCEEFDKSFKKLVEAIHSNISKLEKIPSSHSIYSLPYKIESRLYGVKIDGKYSIIYSPDDFSTSMKSYAKESKYGLPTEEALKTAANILSYGLSH